MTMEIAFSHDYAKLPFEWEGTQAILAATQVIRLDEEPIVHGCPFPKTFIEYDTRFRVPEGNKSHYDLNYQTGIVLFLIHVKTGWVFTTIRPYTPDKWKHYQFMIGKTFTLRKITTDKIPEQLPGEKPK